MNKLHKFLILIGITAVAISVSAHGNNLWTHFEQKLPSLTERALIYNSSVGDGYVGSKEQNELLLEYLHPLTLGALAFPPSTVESPSTAGWTDDGSIVRLNTASDSVGIGTVNPTEKLTVTGGNFRLGGDVTLITGNIDLILGDISIAGGDINLGTGNATTTFTVGTLGAGVGTTTPSAVWSVSGDSYTSGTSTTERLTVHATTTLRGVDYNWPTADGSNGQILSTGGTGQLSWSAAGSAPKFGGDGSDGELNVTTGTTTLALGSQRVAQFDYTSINISSGAGLDFSGSHGEGTIVILRSQGAVTIAGTIMATSTGTMGGAIPLDDTAGNAAASTTAILDDLGGHNGQGGGANAAGTGGVAGSGGFKYATTTAASQATPYATTNDYFYKQTFHIAVGSGGGSGGRDATDATQVGGSGGGAIIIESAGALNFSGIIIANGENGGAGPAGESDNSDGGGGGGAGGMVLILYNSLTANTGAVQINGGNGGVVGDDAGGTSGGNGGGGGGGSIFGAGGAGGTGGNDNAAGTAGANGTCQNAQGSAGTGGTTSGTDGGGGGGGGGGCGSYLIVENLWF